MDEAHIRWCRNLFEMMADGAVWGVPRSGLMLQKRDDTLALVGRMPWNEEMGGTAGEWWAYQADDFEDIRSHFEMAGVKVVKQLSD